MPPAVAAADLYGARARARRAVCEALPQPTLRAARDAALLLDAWLASAELRDRDLDALARALEHDHHPRRTT